MTKFLNNINLEAENDIQFKTAAGTNAGKISQTGDDLVISNAVGDILLGNGSDDIYIGDGTNAVDIRFEQDMAIFADSSSTRTLTLGGANTNLVLESPSIGGSTINGKMTFGTAAGYILFDYEPTTAGGEYSSEVPLLRVDRSGTELTILSRVSNNGAVILGNDDGVAILAGDVKSVIKDNLNLGAEEVVIAAEGGWRSYSFPSNDTSWTNRNEFRFYGADATAANNGLYIGDGGSTQFIDLNRNLFAGAVTLTGDLSLDSGGDRKKIILGSQETYALPSQGTKMRILTLANLTSCRVYIDSMENNYNQPIVLDIFYNSQGSAKPVIHRNNTFEHHTHSNDIRFTCDTSGHIYAEKVSYTTGRTVNIRKVEEFIGTVTILDGSTTQTGGGASDVLEGKFGALTSTGAIEGTSVKITGGASSGFLKADGTVDSSTYITSQRAIDDTPVDGSTTTSISSNWAFDNVKTAVPSNAVFTDTVPSDFVSAASGGTFSGSITISSTYPKLFLTDTDNNDDWSIINNNGQLIIYNETDTKKYLEANTNESIILGDGIDMNYDNISTSNSGTVVRGGFLNPAAEANMVHLPHLINDLAGFNKWSNGTITVSGLYATRSGSAGSYSYSNAIDSSNSGWGNAFDSHSSTAGSWYSDNGTDGVYSHGTDTPGVITLEWPNEATYSLYVGIVFGSGSFTATYVKIEAYRGGAWQTECEITNNTDQVVLRQVASNSGTNNATTKLKYTLGGSVNGSYFRIHSLYMANYRAGDNNLNNTGVDTTRGVNFLERYKDGYLHGHLRPGADNTYDLGSSTYGWKNLHIDGNITVGGSVDGVDISGLPTSFAPTDANNTAANETSHSDVLVDGDFSSAGLMKTDGSGTYSIDSSTYITSQATDFVSAANGGTFAGTVNIDSGSSAVGTLSLRRDTTGDSTIVGDINFHTSAAEGTDDRVGLIRTQTSGGDGTTRGGEMRLYTRQSGSSAFNTTIYDQSGKWSLPGDLVVAGDLNVNGTTTTIDTTNLNVEDNNITLNYSTSDSSASADGAGITIQDAVDASTNATMLWDATNDRFVFSHAVVSGSTVLTGDQDISGIATNAGAITTNANAISNIPAESYTQHENISAASSGLDNSGRTYIQDITLDSNGHVTGVATATETVVNTNTNKFLSAVALTTQGGTGVTFQVTNGTNVTTSIFGTLAFSSADIPSGNQIIDWSTDGSEKVIHASYYTNTIYTHPQYGTTDIDTSGSTIIDSIATNSTGHITAMGTRTLTLGDLGFTGNVGANCVLGASQTLTNKTIDFDSNIVSNIEVGNFKGSSIIFEAEGISNNDTDLCIPTSAAVKDYVDNNSSSANYYLDGISKTNNVLTFSVNGATNQTYEFGANAFNSTAIPSISGLATTTYVDTAESDAISTASADATTKADAALASAQSYADTAETDAIAAAATAAAGLYVPSSGTTTISGTKTITGSLILDDGVGASPTMRFMNADDDEVSIFCNPTGKMKFQQKLVGGSNVVQMTMDENGLVVDNGLKVGTGVKITTILDEDDMATNSDVALATQQSIKAYVTSSVAGAGGGTMSSFQIAAVGTSGTDTIEQGETVTFGGGTGISSSRSGSQISFVNTAPAGSAHLNSNITLSTLGAAAALGSDDNYVTDAEKVVIGNTAGSNSGDVCTTNHTGAGYLTSIPADSVGMDELAHIATNTIIGRTVSTTGPPAALNMTSVNLMLSENIEFTNKELPRGSLVYGDANGESAELAIGTNGQVLKSNGSDLVWGTDNNSGGGGSSLTIEDEGSALSTAATTLNFVGGGVAATGTGTATKTITITDTNTWVANSKTVAGYVAAPGTVSNKVWKTDSSGNPAWRNDSNSNTTYSAGDGIALNNSNVFSVSGGTGLTTDTNGLSLSTGDESNLGGFKIKHAYNSGTPAANNASTTAARTYGVSKNSSDQLVVNVPWTSSGGQPASTVSSVSILSHANLLIGHDGTSSDGMYLDFNSTTEMYIKDNNTNAARVTILASNGNTTFSGEIAAGNFTSQSDRRIKKDIVDVSSHSALDTVMKTQGVRYHIKEENDEGVFPEKHKEKRKNGLKELGFIAQDLEEVLPELVVTAEDDSKSVDYMKMTVVLVEAMKEQQKQIEELKKLINGNT